MKAKMTNNEAYSLYIKEVNERNKLRQKYGMAPADPIKRFQFDLAVTAELNKAKLEGKHHPGMARLSEKFARATTREATNKQIANWNKALKNFGVTEYSQERMRYTGIPPVLEAHINALKEEHQGLSVSALALLIGQEIYGSL